MQLIADRVPVAPAIGDFWFAPEVGQSIEAKLVVGALRAHRLNVPLRLHHLMVGILHRKRVANIVGICEAVAAEQVDHSDLRIS